MNKALIIFVKNLRYGKVKTRLAAKVGDAKAYAIYESLLQHTQETAKAVQADKYVFYSDEIENDTIWNRNLFNKEKQDGHTLGDRMRQAFNALFSKEYNCICIIGSDCLELTHTIVEQAFEALRKADVVIGPAKDGGYYLLGMKKMETALFQHIAWSTDKVLAQTISICHNKGLTYTLLPLLNDIDEEQDWITAAQRMNL